MDSRRKPKTAGNYASERIVGEDQWREGRGTTLGEFLGSWIVWIAIGICLAFLLRAGVLPWLRSYGSEAGWERAALVATSLGATVLGVVTWVWLGSRATRMRRGRAGAASWALPVVLGLCAVVAVARWPSSGGDGELNIELGGRFAFGDSPSRSQMTRLEREGFVGIVSLLHPSEPERAETWLQESEWARELGLVMVLAPLEPEHGVGWGTVDALTGVAQSSGGPWFVESGGDSIRLELGRALLARLTGSTEALPPGTLRSGSFERGPVTRLEDDVYLTPFPTEEELLGEYLGGSVRQVLSLLDPSAPADRVRLDQESGLLARFGIAVSTSPVPDEPFDPLRALAAVELARSLPRPLVVQTFLTPSLAAEAFEIAWSSGLPPLPPGLFEEPLGGGAVTVVRPNLAVGPRPEGREFRDLYNRGVRRIVHVGGGLDAPGLRDRALSDVAGLEWQDVPADEHAFLLLLAVGGPWYVYGSGAEELVNRVPPVPPPPTPSGAGRSREDGMEERGTPSPGDSAPARGTRTFGSEHGS